MVHVIQQYLEKQLSGLKFAEKQLIAIATSHMNFIHRKNGTLVYRGHGVAIKQ
jgi:hypothetical protein